MSRARSTVKVRRHRNECRAECQGNMTGSLRVSISLDRQKRILSLIGLLIHSDLKIANSSGSERAYFGPPEWRNLLATLFIARVSSDPVRDYQIRAIPLPVCSV